jgi:uncharacterized protein YjbJ (UPF0337 family)
MNWDRIQGNWKQFKGKLRERWAQQWDDPVNEFDARREILAGKLQEAYGIGKDKAARQHDEWRKSALSVADELDSTPRGDNGTPISPRS